MDMIFQGVKHPIYRGNWTHNFDRHMWNSSHRSSTKACYLGPGNNLFVFIGMVFSLKPASLFLTICIHPPLPSCTLRERCFKLWPTQPCNFRSQRTEVFILKGDWGRNGINPAVHSSDLLGMEARIFEGTSDFGYTSIYILNSDTWKEALFAESTEHRVSEASLDGQNQK